MKKLLIFALGGLLSRSTWAFAAEMPDSFQVEVNPSSFQVNQPVDLTIKAIKNGKIMKNYEGRIYFEVIGEGIKSDDYILSEQGLDFFKLSDQGVKTYSKGLQVKKPGTYSLKASDLMLETINGEAVIIVTADQKKQHYPIELLSPLPNGKEMESPMNLLASVPQLTNARIQVYLNDLMVKEITTDENGLLSDYLPLTKTGTNVLELKALSLNNQVVGASDKRTFLYEPLGENLFTSIAMTPNQNLKL